MCLSICPSVSIQIKFVSRLGFIFWSDRLPLLLRKEGWIKLFWVNMSIVVFINQIEFFFCAVGCQHCFFQAYPTIPIEIKGEKVMHCRAFKHLAVEFSVGSRDGSSHRSFHSFSAWAPLSMRSILWWLTSKAPFFYFYFAFVSFPENALIHLIVLIHSYAVATIFCVTVAIEKVATAKRASGHYPREKWPNGAATAAGWWIYK